MSRVENVKIFKDTETLCRTNEKLKKSLEDSRKNQRLILKSDPLGTPTTSRFAELAEIIVSKKRTLEAAAAYKGMKTAVHNFASASNPGGGVERGANAQEECLCRCSGLYFCLDTPEMWEGFYKPHRSARDPIHNDDIIFTPDVTVFKTDTADPELMAESEWYDVDVITCAAPNLRERPSNGFNEGDGHHAAKISAEALAEVHEKRLKRILDAAVLEEDEVIILGAFGCGAFRNDPGIVAAAARNVLQEYRSAFRIIEFAVYCPPRDDTNYRIFRQTLI